MIGTFNAIFVVFAILALNLTVFAVALQMDILVFQSDLAKVLAWAVSAGSWHMAYKFRNR